ncbi:hypothetical protein ACM66B_002357 [Microbotryomycetes sp. NB124-2]
MPLKLLHHKSYHVYNADNIARVRRDEAEAARQDDEREQRSMQADSEARLDRMRSKLNDSRNRGRKRGDEDDRGEKELDRQLKRGRHSTKTDRNDEDEEKTNGTVIVRPGDDMPGSSSSRQPPLEHINFWKELETGGAEASKPFMTEAQLQKAIEKDRLEAMTRMYIAKRGEGEPKGWYASEDGQTEEERKRNEEAKLERAYKDGEQKRMTDPLAQMQAYLSRRDDILAGREPSSTRRPHTYRERYLEPATPSSSSTSRTEPVVASLLAPRRRESGPQPLPPPPSRDKDDQHRVHSNSSQGRTKFNDPVSESQVRVTSERARAQALIAQRKRASLSSSASATPSTIRGANDTPRSGDWDNMFNRDAVKEARDRREFGGRRHQERETASSFSSSWGDQKRRRDERVGSRRW